MEKFETPKKLIIEYKKILEDEKYFNDINLINHLSSAFATKGLPRDIPNKLFMELTTLDQLTEIELIWLTKSLYEYEKKVFESFEPIRHFSDLKIIDAEQYVAKEVYTDKIVFENITKVNDFCYISGFTKATDIAIYKKSELFSYEFDTQREGKIKEIGTKGAFVKEVSLNAESVVKIGEMIYDNKYIPDTLTMNVPLLGDGNRPLIDYDEDKRTLTITPNYNTSSKRVTICNTTDGWHRTNGSEYAYDKKIKEGKDPNTIKGGFAVIITLMTPKQAREHFERINTYNPISENYLKTFKTSNESKFIEALVDYNDSKNIFNNNVLRTYEETKAFNKLTYYTLLQDAIKQTDIDVTEFLSEAEELPKIVKFITKFIDYIGETEFKDSNNKYKDIKENTNLLDMNIFIGYFVIADMIKSENEINKYVIALANKLNNDVVKEDLRQMGLNNKHYSAKKIADYFKDLF